MTLVAGGSALRWEITPTTTTHPIDGWVREPGAVGWVAEGDAIGTDMSNRWELANTDYECEHGRLAGDVCPSPVVKFTSGEFKGVVVQNWPHAHPCGCWPSELPELLEPTAVAHVGTPDLMSLLAPRKEPLMLTGAPERLALTVGERTALPAPNDGPFEHAPFGLKRDGTPRKSRAGRKPNAKPAPVVREPDPVREAIEVAALIELPAPAPTTVVHLTASPFLAQIVSDIDAEVARLLAAKARLLAVVA